MIDATYFGEITQLHTRAVWYSDEEDDEDEYEDDVGQDLMVTKTVRPKAIDPVTHDSLRSNVQINFNKINPDLKLNFSSCIISSSSSVKFQNYKLANQANGPCFATFGNYGKAFAFPVVAPNGSSTHEIREYTLWLLFDASHQYLNGQEVCYFVEKLREKLASEFNFFSPNSNNCEIIILSRQFSRGEHIEYLNNFTNNNTHQNNNGLEQNKPLLRMPLPFIGRNLIAPSIIRNNFESSLFEQLTLSLKPAQLVCLPCPRDFLFDRSINWPTIPEEIIHHKLHDNHLDDKYIYT